jgi:hypothetical protein
MTHRTGFAPFMICRAIQLRVAITFVGRHNTFGHTATVTLDMLSERGVNALSNRSTRRHICQGTAH